MCNVETPTPGVVVVDVILGAASSAAPLHWRSGDWTKPPLDLSLASDGRLIGIQFVLQDERVPEGREGSWSVSWRGTPVFTVDGWPRDRYRDERISVSATRSLSGQLVLCLGESATELEWCEVGHDLLLGFAGDQLVKIVVGALDLDDLASFGASVLGS